jgi:hypothetical protein
MIGTSADAEVILQNVIREQEWIPINTFLIEYKTNDAKIWVFKHLS